MIPEHLPYLRACECHAYVMLPDSNCAGILRPSCSSSTQPRSRTWIVSTCSMSQPSGQTPAVRYIHICPRLWVFVFATYYRPVTSILLIETFTFSRRQPAPAIMRNFGWRFMRIRCYTMEVAQTGSIWQHQIFLCIKEMWIPHHLKLIS
jgi:hypothetical protein